MDDNRPWLDMAHIISNLNKLDAGVADRIWYIPLYVDENVLDFFNSASSSFCH